MKHTRNTIQLQKILDTIPSLSGNKNKLTKEDLLAIAKYICERLNRCEYTDDVFRILEQYLPRQLFQDIDNFYRVLFFVNCMMGSADNRSPKGSMQLHLHFHDQVGNVITHVDKMNTNEL